METWDSVSGREELAFGKEPPRRRGGRLLWAAVLLVVLGAAAGWALERQWDDLASEPDRVELVAGSVQRNDREPFGPEFLVSLHNIGDGAVKVVNVAPRGWVTRTPRTTIAPGGWAELPLDAAVYCATTPPPGDEVVVRTATPEGPVTQPAIRLPSVPTALMEKYDRLCRMAPGRAPERRDLLGIWMVERGRDFAANMLIELNDDGTFAMDPSSRLFTRPGAYGTFSLKGGKLELSTHGGSDCQRGDRALWQVGLRDDGLLYIRHISYFDSWCSVPPGEVWVAERVSAIQRPPTPGPPPWVTEPQTGLDTAADRCRRRLSPPETVRRC